MGLGAEDGGFLVESPDGGFSVESPDLGVLEWVLGNKGENGFGGTKPRMEAGFSYGGARRVGWNVM